MKYDKLVRDRIPEIIRGEGREEVVHVAQSQEYWEKLKEKLVEEVREFVEAESIEELADILEVLAAIVEHKKFDNEEIMTVKAKKREERGGFEQRIILDEA